MKKEAPNEEVTMELKKRGRGDDAKFLDPAYSHLHWACQSKGCTEEAFYCVTSPDPLPDAILRLSFSRLLCRVHAASEKRRITVFLKREFPEGNVTIKSRPRHKK